MISDPNPDTSKLSRTEFTRVQRTNASNGVVNGGDIRNFGDYREAL